MPKRNKSTKKTGGREGTQTYCCDSKTSNLGLAGENKGKNCYPSATGQCNVGYGTGQNYKFRCFNVEDKDKLKPRAEILGTPMLDNDYDGDYEECEYVSGMSSRIARTAISPLVAVKSGIIGGHRNTRRNKMSKKRRSTKRRSTKRRSTKRR